MLRADASNSKLPMLKWDAGGCAAGLARLRVSKVANSCLAELRVDKHELEEYDPEEEDVDGEALP